MTDNRRRDVEAVPPGNAGAQSQFGVIGVCKEVLVKPSDLVEHLAAVHSRASIGPQHLLDTVILTHVDLARSSSSILAIEVDQVPGLVNSPGILMNEDLRRRHADIRPVHEGGRERFEPARVRLGVIIQQRDELACGSSESLVVCRAKPNVVRITNQLYPDRSVARELVGELIEDHLRRTVIRSIIYHDDVKWVAGPLGGQGSQAGAEKVAAVPVHHYDRNASALVSRQVVYYTG